MSFQGFSVLTSGGNFVQQSRIILAIYVEGHPRNISVKIFRNRAMGSGGDVI